MSLEVLAYLPKAELGEGTWWDTANQHLYWVDILGQKIHRYDPKTNFHETHFTDSFVGFMVLDERGRMIAGLRDGIYQLDFHQEGGTALAKPHEMHPNNRFNDGKCDRAGRLWVGTMNLNPDETKEPTGALYRYETNRLIEAQSRVHISNGLGWSPDNKTMYYTDTLTHEISKFDYDPETGTASNRRTFVKIPRDEGSPDGLTVDSKGRVITALWGGWRIHIYKADGSLDEVISLPVPQPSNCTFGGPDLKTLYISTAAVGLTADELAKAPLSGHLFSISLGIPGLPETPFRPNPTPSSSRVDNAHLY